MNATFEPKIGERYWCIRGIPRRVATHVWENDRYDQLMRDNNRIYKTEEQADRALAQEGAKE